MQPGKNAAAPPVGPFDDDLAGQPVVDFRPRGTPARSAMTRGWVRSHRKNGACTGCCSPIFLLCCMSEKRS